MSNEKRRVVRIEEPSTVRDEDSDTYRLVVEFERSLSDDVQCAADNGYPESARGMVAQFVRELQEVYDEGFLAGSFKVLEIDAPVSLPEGTKEELHRSSGYRLARARELLDSARYKLRESPELREKIERFLASPDAT